MFFKSATLGGRIRSSSRENKYDLSRTYCNVVRSYGRLLLSVITTMWACAAKNDTLELSDREGICPICRMLNQRDPNAACNIEVETLRILDLTPGLAA
jgi:succinate dehydrogenase/fumarate reductase-like Fe-S protein